MFEIISFLFTFLVIQENIPINVLCQKQRYEIGNKEKIKPIFLLDHLQ